MSEEPSYPCEGAEWGVCGGEPHARDCPSWNELTASDPQQVRELLEGFELETSSVWVTGAAFPWSGPNDAEPAT